MKTLVYSIHSFDQPYLEKAAFNKHQFTFTNQSLSENTANLAKGYEAICIFTADDANEKTLELLYDNSIKHIAIRAAGHDNVNLEKCHQLKIKVANAPQYSPFAIAEHAMTLILCLNRKINLSQELGKKHDFRLDNLIGFDMKGKTIGIIGTGRIGATFARIANGFGCKLLAFDIAQNELLKKEINIRYVSLEELCKNSDIISLHCPLNNSTKHLLNQNQFAIMKDGVFIINTSRGSIINTKDLLTALNSKKIGGAGLDVYEFEKGLFFENHQQINDELFNQLQANPNVIITPHQAFLTNEALKNIADTVIYNLDCWSNNRASINEI
jgi:D-lactate dehydrogenase